MENESLISLRSQISDLMIEQDSAVQPQVMFKTQEIDKKDDIELNLFDEGKKEFKLQILPEAPQSDEFISTSVQNKRSHDDTIIEKTSQISPLFDPDNPKNQESQNNDFHFSIEKLLINDNSSEELIRKNIFQKTFVLKLNDKKLYNTKWISRLQQTTQPIFQLQKLFQNFHELEVQCKMKPLQKNHSRSQIQKHQKQKGSRYKLDLTKTQSPSYPIFLELKYPLQLIARPQKFLSKQNQSNQKIKQKYTNQKQDSSSDLNQTLIEEEDVELVISYYYNDSIIANFIEEPLDECQYPSTEFSIRSYLTHSQILKISANYPNFWTYVKSRALNEFFLVRVLSLDDVFNDSVESITLLEKIIAFRKYFDFQKSKKASKKNSNKAQKTKLNKIPSFTSSKQYELHGRRQLLQQLWDLYGSSSNKTQTEKLEKSYVGNISFTTRLTSKKNETSKISQLLKFVQFVPSLSINENNYSKFIKEFSELKKVYFNGMSVGFKGFRISNFTTRSQNNITFVFQDFHELATLQALLIDFEFPLQFLEQLQKEYQEYPKKKIKKLRIKVGNQAETKPWVEDMFQKPTTSLLQKNNKNMSFSMVDNITMIKPSEPKFISNRDNNFGNGSSVNSSFFLNPMGYCQNPAPPQIQGFQSKEISFCRIDKEKPDYEKLIMYLNSITEVSKTVIIDFEKIFELFQYKNQLTSLINVCCNFEAADLQLLPQPLEIVKVHQDHKTNILNIKEQVKQLLENEEKFACLNLPNTQVKINSINCFNIIKMNEEYQSRLILYKRIKQKYLPINQENQISKEHFEESISTVELILSNKKAKNEFVCFPFHNKTFKIVRYFEPGSNNLLDLQLKQTNQRSQNFIPSQEATFNQYKQRMIRQGVDFFYFSYPFGEKFKLNLKHNNIYALGVKNQIKFRKEDHLRVMYWFSKINRTQYKLVFYEQSRLESKRQQYIRSFTKEKLPTFEQLYEFGFVEESLKEKIAQVEVYTGNNKKNPKSNHLIFKKSIQRFLLNYSGHDRSSKNQKTQSYRILTNRSTWDFILKKLKTICEDKEKQLRRMLFTEEDDKEFQIIKKSLKSLNQ